MVISNFLHPFFWWRQKIPKGLKPNCLLTRYPILFLSEPTLLERLDPWNGIPQFLKNHGYDVKISSDLNEKLISKCHLVVNGKLSVKIIHFLTNAPAKKYFSSVTLVDPLFDFSESELQILEKFSPPSHLLFGSLHSRESAGSQELKVSQRIAKSWGPVFNTYLGKSSQLRGRGPRPSQSPSAHEFFLQHCIFLAEYDLTTAE